MREAPNASLAVQSFTLQPGAWTKLVDDNVNRTYLSILNNVSNDSIEVGFGSNTVAPTTSFIINGGTLQSQNHNLGDQIAHGDLDGHHSVEKFGQNSDVNNVEETVWEGGGIYVYPSAAITMTATSASGAADVGVEVTMEGLDANYVEQSVVVTLDAAGTFTTTETFIRIFRAYVSGATEPAGVIDITNTGVTYAHVNGDRQTMMSLWTVPAGHTGFLRQFIASAHSETANRHVTIRLISRLLGKVFRTQDVFVASNGSIVKEHYTPLVFPEKTDIEVRAIASSAASTANVTATMSITYERDEHKMVDQSNIFTFTSAPINAVWAKSSTHVDHVIKAIIDV